MVVLLLLAVDYRVLELELVPGSRVGMYFFCVLTMLVGMTGSYIFVLLAFFDDSVIAILRNAFLMSLRYFPRTLLVLLTSFGPITSAVACYQSTHLPLYLCLVFGAAFSARVNTFFLYPVFQKHLPEGTEG